MTKVKSLMGKMTPDFIDYCNLNNIDLIKWYRWQLHLIWEQRNLGRKLSNQNLKEKENGQNERTVYGNSTERTTNN